MKFCLKCGRTLAILEQTGDQFCEKCRAASTVDAPAAVEENGIQQLLTATLSLKKGRLVLESTEGWLLWSGADDQPHSLQSIVDRAGKILKIQKRQKK